MQEVKFTCTSLAGTGRAGRLPVDADGYYTQPIGALNCFNSAKQYYPADTARHLFQQSSAFMRRIKTGCLKGECGHPKMLPGQSNESFVSRVMSIEEKSVAVHFSEIWLDLNSVKDERGMPLVAVMGKFKPSGPYGPALEAAVNNPKEDVCFSVRAFTDDQKRMGVTHRNLVDIVTYDWVTEPGINVARKYKSPALEEHGEQTFTRSHFETAVAQAQDHGFAMEAMAQQTETLFRALGWDLSHLSAPKFLSW